MVGGYKIPAKVSTLLLIVFVLWHPSLCVPNKVCVIYTYVWFLQTMILISSAIMSQDPDIFEDPEDFRPERWLRDTDKTSRYRQQLATGIFGFGPRMCLGLPCMCTCVLCMCDCVCVCMCVCVRVCVWCVCVCACVCVYMCCAVCICVCFCVYAYICVFVW